MEPIAVKVVGVEQQAGAYGAGRSANSCAAG